MNVFGYSALGVIALLITTVSWMYRSRLKHEFNLIRQTPPENRREVILELLKNKGFFPVSKVSESVEAESLFNAHLKAYLVIAVFGLLLVVSVLVYGIKAPVQKSILH